jgi:tetratricopeptide (TPR) repeat protein
VLGNWRATLATQSLKGRSLVINEDWDKPMKESRVLLFERRPDEALRVLEEARNRYAASKDLELASFYSNLAGSCLASQGCDREALDAYELAEKLDPRGIGNKIAIANHLLLRMSRAEAARSKADEVLQMSAGNKALEHSALAVRGLADLELKSYGSAIRNFRELSRPEMLQELYASSCDLRLADRLLKIHLEQTGCKEYLLQVNRKAEREGDITTREAVRQILSQVSS